MLPVLQRQAVRDLDRDAVQRLGLPSLALMENAGIGATDVILGYCEAPQLERVLILGGPGQNGGDGWVVARQLHNRGYRPLPILIGDESKLKGDARINFDVLQNLGVEALVSRRDGMERVSRALEQATLVVDAMFGTGLDRRVEGEFAEVIELVNDAELPCVALDIPSGIDADTGAVLGVAVDASLTPTFGALKRGLFQYPGAGHAGHVRRVSIGIPEPTEADAMLVELADVGRWLPPRPAHAHKGSAGHVLVIAGSPGRTGAAYLSGYGALRGGAGLVTLAARGEARAALDQKVVELMTAEVPMDADAAVQAALRHAEGKAAAVLGPGIGLDEPASRLARSLSRELPVPTVLDADALTAIGTNLDILKGARAARVLTPHPGEAARLLGSGSGDVQADRYGAARRIAEESGHIVVLKGAGTVVASPAGRLWLCGHGTPALGVAGTGDILSGLIAALLAELEDVERAAAAAVVLHARAGEVAAVADRGLLAREVADAVPGVLRACQRLAAGSNVNARGEAGTR